MKFGKLAVSLTAAAVMGAYGTAFAQNTSTYTTGSDSSSSGPSMRNTDENAPAGVQQYPDMTTQDSLPSNSPDQPSTPQSGSSSSMDEQSSSSGASSSIDHDQPLPQSVPSGGTYRTDSASGSGSSGSDPVTPSQSGRQPAPY